MVATPLEGRPIGFSIDYLDRSVDPGKDFYGFATGGWRKENPIPPDQAIWGSFTQLRRRNREQLRSVAESAMRPSGPSSNPVREVGTLYPSALNRRDRNELGFRPITAHLSWVDRVETRRDLLKVVAGLHEVGYPGLFQTDVDSDFKQSSVYAFYLSQGGLSLPDRDYYLADSFEKLRAAYRAHVARIFGLAGSSEPEATAASETVAALETELAKASRTRADTRDVEKNYHRMSIGELLAYYPSVPWAEYLQDRRADLAGYVVVRQPEFFSEVERLVLQRPISDWKVYLRWHVLHSAAPLLHEAAEQENFAFFHRELLGQARPEPDWELAIQATDELLGEALGELYVERFFPPEARNRMSAMVSDLMAVFRDRLAHLDWMTEPTRRRALEKFERFTPMIGAPVRYRDYSSIVLREDEFAANCLRARAFEVRRRMARIGGPVDRDEWQMTPPTPDAYHDPTQVQIVFPAGILQPPFFDVTMDDAVNYGAIGAVIGHEITHGFDDQGRKFDAHGNVADWWTDADAREFSARVKVVEEEYARLEVLPGLHVNGKLTLGENIADIGGVSIAFEALERRLAADPSRAQAVDGFTPAQRFCLSWSQTWRANVREEEARRRATIDPHAPARFRGQVPLAHLPAFFEAFPQSGESAAAVPSVRIW